MIEHTCNSSAQKPKVGESQLCDNLGHKGSFEASLLCLKIKKENKYTKSISSLQLPSLFSVCEVSCSLFET